MQQSQAVEAPVLDCRRQDDSEHYGLVELTQGARPGLLRLLEVHEITHAVVGAGVRASRKVAFRPAAGRPRIPGVFLIRDSTASHKHEIGARSAEARRVFHVVAVHDKTRVRQVKLLGETPRQEETAVGSVQQARNEFRATGIKVCTAAESPVKVANVEVQKRAA